jgi:pimeloyl-ACP methyl ester carboxylesterase
MTLLDRRRFTRACVLAAGGALRPWLARAEDVSEKPPSTGHLNAVTPTLGGRQFWADEHFFHDWHIQRNVFTGHYRLLDGSNLRRAWGTFDECRAKLAQIRDERRLPAMNGPAVVVLHGLFRSGHSMGRMARFLREKGGYSVFNVNYPTTRGPVTDHAQSLAKVIASLEGIEEINFVAHSLGNLVVRHYLGDNTNVEAGVSPDPRIGRMVMLGPPNQGAQLAEALGQYRLFHVVAGQSASQLGRDWQHLEARLATPACPFGILAGGRGTETGYNPLLGRDNDMIVSVECTRLAGAADFAVLPVLHTLMMDDAKVQEYTLRFLQHGYFISKDQCQPIALTAPRPAAAIDANKIR